jgi:protocatechuate 3,4-dioxygenase beta subunit
VKLIVIAGYFASLNCILLSQSSQTAAPRRSAESSAGGDTTASIEGQVVNLNTGAGLRKANVRLTGGPAAAHGPTNNVSTDTDDQGHFVLTGLEPGQYQLWAQKSGFVGQNYGVRRLTGQGMPLNLTNGERLKGAVIKLMPGAVISGTVRDEVGEPVSNAQVTVLQSRFSDGQRRYLPIAGDSTSDVGEFRIAGLGPGEYIVQTSPQNLNLDGRKSSDTLPEPPEMGYPITYFPNSTEQSTAGKVSVLPGAELRGIDVNLAKMKVYRVRGHVSMSGLPSGQRVSVMLIPNNVSLLAAGWSAFAQLPDLNFEIKNVAPGSYMAYAVSPGSSRQMALVPVNVVDGHVDGLTLTLSSGRTIQGSIKLAEKEAQADLTQVAISLRSSGMVSWTPSQATIEPNLKFAISNVGPLKYKVTVSGLQDNFYVHSVTYGGREINEGGVDMEADAGIEVVVGSRGAQLDVIAVDGGGKPVPGAAVGLIPKDRSITGNRSVVTDQNGQASFKSLRPGDYEAIAFEDVEPGSIQDSEFIKQFESGATEEQLAPGMHGRIQLKVIPSDAMAGQTVSAR